MEKEGSGGEGSLGERDWEKRRRAQQMLVCVLILLFCEFGHLGIAQAVIPLQSQHLGERGRSVT